MLLWMERQGYNVAYSTDVDTDRSPALLRQHRAFLSVGHDEYWSKAMRANVEAALSAGVNLGFFGGNDIYWNFRFGDSSLGADRVMICYKEASRDPLYNIDNSNVTVRWREAPLNRPENALMGQMSSGYLGSGDPGYPFVVTNPTSWVYHGVDVTAGTGLPTMVGYEYDRVFDNGSTPPNLVVVSQSAVIDHAGTHDVANATVYTAPSGATVFSAGTIQWADSLDNFAYGGVQALDSRAQGITANVLARLGQAPGSTVPAVTPTPAEPVGPNIVGNAGFESGDTGWHLVAQNGGTTSATWSIQAGPAPEGAAFAHIVVGPNALTDLPPVLLSQHITSTGFIAGSLYTVRFWARASTRRPLTVGVLGTTTGTGLASVGLTVRPEWQSFEFTFRVARAELEETLTFSMDAAVAGNVWLDGVELQRGQPTRPMSGL